MVIHGAALVMEVMTMQLRDYQMEASAAISREWGAGHRRTLLVLPTGCG